MQFSVNISKNNASNHFASESPINDYKAWMLIFTAKSNDELLKTAKYLNQKMRLDNPVNKPCFSVSYIENYYKKR